MTVGPTAVRTSQVPAERIRRACRHRAELLAAIQGFEGALAAPFAHPAWRLCVAAELAGLRVAFGTHVELTEGPDGLYAEVLGDAPRLLREVRHLRREHVSVYAALEAIAGQIDAEPERLRYWGASLLTALSRHRQRGADLVYSAYSTDIGGET